MHKVRIFYNEKASRTERTDWRGKIEQKLFRSELDFVSASSKKAFIRALRRLATEKVDAFISVGGDGTFNTILQELSETNTPFLIIPTGTANDLARELGISYKIGKALDTIRKNEITQIDLISVNDRLMATNGGFGLFAEVAQQVNGLRDSLPIFKPLMSKVKYGVYGATLGTSILTKDLPYLNFHVDSEGYSGNIISPLILINNQPSIAGNFCVAPSTRNDDGRFNVLIFTHTDRRNFANAVWRIKRGLGIEYDTNILSFETDELTITCKDRTIFYGDGERLAKGTKFHFKIRPSALKLFNPAATISEHYQQGSTSG